MCAVRGRTTDSPFAERVVGNATRAWDVHVEIDAGVFLCATACTRGARRPVRQSETDRQPVYDIQRALGHARTRPSSCTRCPGTTVRGDRC